MNTETIPSVPNHLYSVCGTARSRSCRYWRENFVHCASIGWSGLLDKADAPGSEEDIIVNRRSSKVVKAVAVSQSSPSLLEVEGEECASVVRDCRPERTRRSQSCARFVWSLFTSVRNFNSP